ncbi:hypothetical protein [[Kitasatospora] papulosa]|uniref:hypothetical protein n=1 Tax=[Kitasatospora] papulosa TaxID=1464011 RepID=UPI00370FC99A
MKTNPDDGGKYSVGLNGVFKRTLHHLRVSLKKAERGPLDLGYEALRGAAYKAGGGLVSAVILWVATRR